MSPTSIVGIFVVGIMALLVTTVNLNNEVDLDSPSSTG